MSEKSRKSANTQANWIAAGLLFGTAAGVTLGNLGLGLAFGLAAATLANALNEQRMDYSHASRAVAIALLALLVVTAIWVVELVG